MQGQHEPQPKLFYQINLDELVPQDDFYRILERAVGLSFVRLRTAHLYSYTGRPSVDPEVIIKLLLIAYLEGTTSERQLMRQVQVTAGGLVLLGALVPGLRWLAALMGAGLVFAGATGWCGMAWWTACLTPRSADASCSR